MHIKLIYSLPTILVLLLVLFSSQVYAVPGRGVLYGTDAGAGNLVRVNPNNGVGTVVGPTGVGGLPSLAINFNTIFAGSGGGDSNLFELDPNTGTATFIGFSGLPFAAISGMDFSASGALCAAVNIVADGGSGGDHLAIIDPNTGLATVIGPFGICQGGPNGSCTLDGIEAIAFDAQGNLWGSLRASPNGSGTPGLYLIDTGTGAASFVSPIVDTNGTPVNRGGVVSLQFACNGTLYGGTAQSGQGAGNGGSLVRIDPNTGIFSFVSGVSATGGSSLGGLAFERDCISNVPTLSEWGFIAMAGILGLVSLLVLYRKRARAEIIG